MNSNEQILKRVKEIIDEANSLIELQDHEDDDFKQYNVEADAWLIPAGNIVHALCIGENNLYIKKTNEILSADPYETNIFNRIELLKHLLVSLLKDIEAGLLTSIADRASGETFDNFLDHADYYLSKDKKQEAGAIAGIVFEDSLRRICRKHQELEKDIPLDKLISALTNLGVLTATKAKRARAAAHVRNKAAHAQWDEFDLRDVGATIDIARELIVQELDG